jgi:hypothetical protein
MANTYPILLWVSQVLCAPPMYLFLWHSEKHGVLWGKHFLTPPNPLPHTFLRKRNIKSKTEYLFFLTSDKLKMQIKIFFITCLYMVVFLILYDSTLESQNKQVKWPITYPRLCSTVLPHLHIVSFHFFQFMYTWSTIARFKWKVKFTGISNGPETYARHITSLQLYPRVKCSFSFSEVTCLSLWVDKMTICPCTHMDFGRLSLLSLLMLFPRDHCSYFCQRTWTVL